MHALSIYRPHLAHYLDRPQTHSLFVHYSENTVFITIITALVEE